MASQEGVGTHVEIVVHDDEALSVIGVEARQLAKWLESLGCTTVVAHQSDVHHLVSLSEREREILGLIGAGLSNAEIGSRLFLSLNTIKSYIRSGYAKIGVSTRSGAVRWAIRHDLARADHDADHRPVDDRS